MAKRGRRLRWLLGAIAIAAMVLTVGAALPVTAAAPLPGSILFTPSSGAFQGELVQFTAYGFGAPVLPLPSTLIGITAHVSINGIPFENVPALWTNGTVSGSFVMPGGPAGTVYNVSINATAEYQFTRKTSVDSPLYGTTWATTWGPACVAPCTPNGFHLLVNLTGPNVGYMGTTAVTSTGANDLTNSAGVLTPFYLYVDSFVPPTTSSNGSATYTIYSDTTAINQVSASTVEVIVPAIPINQTVGPSTALTGFYTFYRDSTYLGTSLLEGHANATLALDPTPATPAQTFEFWALIAILALLAAVLVLEVIILRRQRRPPVAASAPGIPRAGETTPPASVTGMGPA